MLFNLSTLLLARGAGILFNKRMRFLFLLLFVTACAHASPNLKPVPASILPTGSIDDLDQGDYEAGSRALLTSALKKQIEQCKQSNLSATWDFAGKKVTKKHWCVDTAQWFLDHLAQAKTLSEVYEKAKKELNWFQSIGRPDTHDVEFTGYFYPIYQAKKVQDSKFKYPVYRNPSDLVQVVINGTKVWRRKVGNQYVPYYTREEIANGALKGQGLEIGYLDNPVDAYMLEIEGSGALLFQETDKKTTEVRQIVNYSSQNGYTYVSLGKLMRAAGIPEEYINYQGIKKYFTEVHPEEWLKFSNQNPSHVFFKEADAGPYGSSGAILTAKHSIAVDQGEFAMGAIGLIQTQRPATIEGNQATSWKTFTQFIVAQDTGGAIQTPGRVDVFWGEGQYAEVAAGRTDAVGSLFFALVPDKK